MLSANQKEEFASLRVEIMDLNVLVYFFLKKINRYCHLWRTTTREYILEELIALRYMENGIILHLTNLDDDSDNSQYSFRTVAKSFNKVSKDPKSIHDLKETLKIYRKNINNL